MHYQILLSDVIKTTEVKPKISFWRKILNWIVVEPDALPKYHHHVKFQVFLAPKGTFTHSCIVLLTDGTKWRVLQFREYMTSTLIEVTTICPIAEATPIKRGECAIINQAHPEGSKR